jgi:hypothetical protein
MQFILAIAQSMDFYLTAVEFSFADNANTLVIQRVPFPESIFGAQDREAIIEFEMSVHNAKSSLLIASKRTIGAADDSLDD